MSVRHELSKSLRIRRMRIVGRVRRALDVGAPQEISTYRQMRADNEQSPSVYQPGKFWAEINAEFERLIWAGGLRDLRTEYFNRRFSGPDPASRQVWHALLWTYYRQLKAGDYLGFLDREGEPPEGGTADEEIIGGKPVSLDFLQSVEEVYRILDAWTRTRPSTNSQSPVRLVMELGAGYGRVAYVCRKMLPDTTYVIFDLPEALLAASSWLTRVLPGEVVPYAEGRKIRSLTRETLLSRNVWLFGPERLNDVVNDAADAFLNVYSLAEMPANVIANYIAQIDRITSGVFYTKQRNREDNIVDGVTISREGYPIPSRWVELYSRPSTLYEQAFEAAYSLGARETQPR